MYRLQSRRLSMVLRSVLQPLVVVNILLVRNPSATLDDHHSVEMQMSSSHDRTSLDRSRGSMERLTLILYVSAASYAVPLL